MIKARLFLFVFIGLLMFSGCSKEEQFENHQTPHEFKLAKKKYYRQLYSRLR